MSLFRLLVLTAAMGLSAPLVTWASVPEGVQAEVSYLLSYIGTSGCRFYRNGAGYESSQAESHLREKYLALVATGQIRTTEDFLTKAATRSSLTGWPYKVGCGTSEPVPSGPWLLEILTHHRAERRVSGVLPQIPVGSHAVNRA